VPPTGQYRWVHPGRVAREPGCSPSLPRHADRAADLPWGPSRGCARLYRRLASRPHERSWLPAPRTSSTGANADEPVNYSDEAGPQHGGRVKTMLWRHCPSVTEAGSATCGETMISFRAVSKTYPGRTRAVDGVNLDIPTGKLTVFVGPSGCGKTTSL